MAEREIDWSGESGTEPREGTMAQEKLLEIEVITGVGLWLHSNGWRIEMVSVPTNQKSNKQTITKPMQLEMIKSSFTTACVPMEHIRFSSKGPDIEARRGDELWRIECKGLTEGVSSTAKNHFDRAVASAVSYYTLKEGLRIGIALPDDELSLKHIARKLPQPLREATNLWLFLYASKYDVYEFAPYSEFPF